MKTPRDYQLAAVQAVFDFFARNPDVNKNPLVAMPTGTGKSAVIAGIVIRMLAHTNPHHRFLIVTHSAELVRQNAEELLEFWPDISVGIHCASLGKRDTMQAVIFGTVGSVSKTLAKNPNAFGPRGSCIIDEAHMIPPKEDAMYQRLISALRSVSPGVRFIGLTATPFRTKQGILTDGGLFSDFAINLSSRDSFNRFIREGYLVPLVAFPTETQIDVSNVKITAGEFNSKQLEEVSNVERISHAAIQEMLAKGVGRSCWSVFCSSIAHTESVARICDSLGIETDYAHSKRKNEENERAKARLRSGEIRCLVSGDMLTTGFNVPQIDLIGMLRPTMSSALHVQMAGRGTRPFPGKANCLFLDFAGNVSRLGPINDPVLPRKPGEKKGEPPVKICPHCKAFNHSSARTCHFCLGEFPEPKTKLKENASNISPMVGLNPPRVEEWPVETVVFRCQTLKSGAQALKVIYSFGYHSASKLLLFDAQGFPRKVAHDWWKLCAKNSPLEGAPVPASVVHAVQIANNLRKPKLIRVEKAEHEQYWRVTGERFD